ncbi:MAG: hypothetical protein KF777_11485 [Planctomycetaceae bacterium]|nr:hypothetical protein [Planctomycetaceae bacterium]
MQSIPSVGVLELLILLTGGGGFLGQPPGQRDADLIKLPPAHAQVYVEWAERSAGKPGAPGIDGWIADPEIVAFVDKLEGILNSTLDKAADRDSHGKSPRELADLTRELLSDPGCLFVAMAPPIEGSESPLLSLPARLEGAVVLSVGEDRASATFAAIVQLIVDRTGWEHTTSGNRVVFVPEAAGTPLAIPLTVMQLEGRVAVAYGTELPERIAQRLANGAESELAARPEFADAWNRVTRERLSLVAWADVPSLMTAILPGLSDSRRRTVETVTNGLGLRQLGPWMGAISVENGEVVQRSWLATAPGAAGLLRLFSGPPLTAEALARVPADADFVGVKSLSLAEIDLGVREGLRTIAPIFEALYGEAVKQTERDLGISFQLDVLAGIGDTWTLYNAPSTGGLLLSGPILSVNLRDPQRGNVVFSQLMIALKRRADGGKGDFRLEQTTFQDFPLYTMIFDDDDAAFAPSFAITPHQIVAALHPQCLKAHLRFIADGGASFAKTRSIPNESIGWLWVDTPRVAQTVLAVWPWAVSTLAAKLGDEGVRISAVDFPSNAAILPYLKPMSVSMTRPAEGILLEVRNPILVSFAGPAMALTQFLAKSKPVSNILPVVRDGNDGLELEVDLGKLPEDSSKGVQQAGGESDASESPSAAWRKWLPFATRALLPDEAERYIPDSVFERLQNAPVLTPEERLERRQQRQRERARRRGETVPPSSAP